MALLYFNIGCDFSPFLRTFDSNVIPGYTNLTHLQFYFVRSSEYLKNGEFMEFSV